MPAAKTLRGQNRKAARNRSTRSFTRNRIRVATEAMEQESRSSETSEAIKAAFSALDRAVSKGVLHRNTAARKKSRLSKQYSKTSI